MSESFTHKNIEEVEDAAKGFGAGDHMEARFATGEFDAEKTGFSHHRIRAGKRQGFGHVHENAEEVYVVISGAGRVKLDDEIVDLVKLDAVRVAPTVTRQFEASEEGDLELLAFGPHMKGDGELVHDFWTD